MTTILRPALPEIALLGEWNTSNLGDRAIHASALDFLESCGWRVRSCALGSLLPVADPRMVGLNGLSFQAVVRRAPGMSPPLRRMLRAVRQNLRALRLAPALAGVRAIAVGGGALLSDANLHFPQSLDAVRRLAVLLGVPLVCVGCGAEGAWSPAGRRAFTRFLSACTLVAVRDGATAQRVSGVLSAPADIGLFGDFCLDDVLIARPAPRVPHQYGLAVNVTQLSGRASPAEQQSYEDALVELLRAYCARPSAARGTSLELFTTGVPEDAVAARRVLGRLTTRRASLFVPRSVQELGIVLRGSGLVVAARLHAAVLALAAHTPVIGYSPRPKLAEFFDTIGLSAYAVGPGAPGVQALLESGHASLWEEQRAALLRAPVWARRAQVREDMARAAAQCARAPAGV